MVERLEYHALCQNKLITNLWMSNLRTDLDRWKENLTNLQTHSTISFRWLSNLYYYNILALFPNMNLALQSEEVFHVVSAASQVLRNFRFVQIPEQKACYTWTAVCPFNSPSPPPTDSLCSSHINSKRGSLFCIVSGPHKHDSYLSFKAGRTCRQLSWHALLHFRNSR